MLPLLLLLAALPADTCRFDLPGVIRQNPDAPHRVQPLLAREAVDSAGMYAGWAFLAPGMVVPEHEHDGDEMLWVVCGGARFRVADQEVALTQGASLRIPRGTRHAALVGAAGMVVVQVYRPGGAGHRFYGWDEVHGRPE